MPIEERKRDDEMLELVNLSNFTTDNALVDNDANVLDSFLAAHNLDGLEMMLCAPWESTLHKKQWVKGVHLRFWPNWMDFWLGNRDELLREFGSEDKVKAVFGGLKREDWLVQYQRNILAAVEAGAQYLVFHVSQVRMSEIFRWDFYYNSKEVIRATLDMVNELVHHIPENTALLFENLWWPGLTLQDKDLVDLLLSGIRHPNIGIMLDVGHLMNTRQSLRTEQEGVKYVLQTVKELGCFRSRIKGMHLHHSLSGNYVKETQQDPPSGVISSEEVMRHILRIDQHLPFTSIAGRALVDTLRPEFLVHEFMQYSLEDWSNKVKLQRAALGC